MTVRLEGVLPIIPTPFDQTGAVDSGALRALVEFGVDGGATALVFPGVASEDVHLSAAERRDALMHVVDAAAGRLPIIAGVNSADPEVMVDLARTVADLNVDGVMAMAVPAMGDNLVSWFKRLSDALDGGVIILQNLFAPRGADLSARQMLDLAAAVPAIRYVKEEGVPSGPKVSELVAGCGPNLDGVIGGGGARYLFEELERGAIATMPAIELLELHVALMRAYTSGDRERALTLYTQSLPLLLIQAPYRMRLTKLILKHRQVMATDLVREALPEMDETLKALTLEFYDRALSSMERVHA
ncbi:dihydrodipicolinate synthase family protein [Rhizobium sp. SSA_523]|uniref:dihydrodipicolinate synthase family protein n=1 Tax=Rhizobium sp. SSA_523 TaxID=2952477 RepID=UPI002091DCF2|nr:dihydrodipicolinate synthase family protein [Rhizobium sp. SSA_523]MCO5732199.1 dihydrodipicolinate synthase family protein [Rhizobium sp. SSA_523]WKC21387.1 dihydrodipicolinate synthase family protein [Rhizobium sp. SSA_523]